MSWIEVYIRRLYGFRTGSGHHGRRRALAAKALRTFYRNLYLSSCIITSTFITSCSQHTILTPHLPPAPSPPSPPHSRPSAPSLNSSHHPAAQTHTPRYSHLTSPHCHPTSYPSRSQRTNPASQTKTASAATATRSP